MTFHRDLPLHKMKQKHQNKNIVNVIKTIIGFTTIKQQVNRISSIDE